MNPFELIMQKLMEKFSGEVADPTSMEAAGDEAALNSPMFSGPAAPQGTMRKMLQELQFMGVDPSPGPKPGGETTAGAATLGPEQGTMRRMLQDILGDKKKPADPVVQGVFKQALRPEPVPSDTPVVTPRKLQKSAVPEMGRGSPQRSVTFEEALPPASFDERFKGMSRDEYFNAPGTPVGPQANKTSTMAPSMGADKSENGWSYEPTPRQRLWDMEDEINWQNSRKPNDQYDSIPDGHDTEKGWEKHLQPNSTRQINAQVQPQIDPVVWDKLANEAHGHMPQELRRVVETDPELLELRNHALRFLARNAGQKAVV